MSEQDPTENNGRFAGIENASANSDTATPLRFVTNVKPDASGTMWEVTELEGQRWNKLYPYQLIVVEKTESGWKDDLRWKFTLPIPPQSIDIDMPFAITTSATLGGVIEEHNGAPFRMISMAGTTGVLPLKGAPDTLPQFKIPQSIFAGTVNSAITLATDLTRGFGLTQSTNIVDETVFSDPTSSINKTSGYYQYHLLKEFLESYAEIKKKSDSKNLRLAFAMWKDRSIYLVTPMSFRLNRTAESPYEYRYSLQLKAWSRINLNGAEPSSTNYKPMGRDPSQIANVLNKLTALRGVLQDSRKILQSARGDINKALFTPLREACLMLKEISGTGKALGDFPVNIIKDCKESILADDLNQFKSFLEASGIQIDSNTGKPTSDSIDKVRDLWIESGKANTKSGNSQNAPTSFAGPNPANKIFNYPDDYPAFFGAIDPSRLKLPPKIQKDMQLEAARVAAYTRKDMELIRDSFVSVLEDFCEHIGMGSQLYNSVYGVKPKATSAPKVATEDDIDLMYNLNALIMEANKLCVSNKMDPNKTDSLQYIAGLAKKSGIAFTEPKSKFLVPFPYQHTLEQVAQLYLNDSERWYEIAALNGLRQPYIDEVGFDVMLMTNGAANAIQIADATNLYDGQVVWISSATVKPEKRRITGIKNVTAGVYVATLDGNWDLNRFTLIAQAKIHAYLPDTVNSQMSIYIPSSDPINEEDFQVKPIQGVNYFDNLIRVGGISLLLTPNNDIAFASDGRSQLAVGLTNIVQKARIALSTPKGALLTHPGYGLPVKAGDSTADVDAKDVLRAIQDMFAKDPTFSSITSASVQKTGPVTRISINIGIAGSSQNVPITAEIRR